MLLLILLTIFFVDKSNPGGSAYPAPPPQYGPKKPEKKDKTVLVVVIVILLVVALVIAIGWVIAENVRRGVGKIKKTIGEFIAGLTATPSAELSYISREIVNTTYYYNTTVLETSRPIEAENVTVYISDYININLNATRADYADQATGVYVRWFDINQNYRLDKGDKISIKTDNIDLSGETLKLKYIPTEGTIAWKYMWRG